MWWSGKLRRSDFDEEKDREDLAKLCKETEEFEAANQNMRKKIPKIAFNIDNATMTGGSRGMYAVGSRVRKPANSGMDLTSPGFPSFTENQPHLTTGLMPDPNEHTSDLLNTMQGEINTILSELDCQELSGPFLHQELPERQKQSSIQRRAVNENSWQDIRPSLMDGYCRLRADVFDDQLCQSCSLKNCRVRCLTCCAAFCTRCDSTAHKFNALHDRIGMASDGSAMNLLPEQSIDEDGNLFLEDRFIGLSIRCRCGRLTKLSAQFASSVIAVGKNGRYDAKLPSGYCDACDLHIPALSRYNKTTLVSCGYWPGSPTQTQGIYIFRTDLFDFLDSLKGFLPSVSVFAFVRTLDDLTRTRHKVSSINATAFSEAFSEYRRCKYSNEKSLGVEAFACPACDQDYHAIHIDGIMKLYRFFSTNKSTQPSYFGEDFISSKVKVESLVEVVRGSQKRMSRPEETEVSSASCGDATFSAAKDKPARYRSLDETGLCSACCRHGVMLSAVNMYRGEIFAYPLSVQVALAERGIVPKFLCQDVICKYHPWLMSTVSRFPHNENFQKVKLSIPFLSVFHAKTHNTTCQLLRGGRTVPDSANQTGEEMEQVHADISRLQQVTKRMRPELREETITLHAAAHNLKKVSDLPSFLYERLLKTLYEHKELYAMLCKTGKSIAELEELKQEVQDRARLADSLPHAKKLTIEELVKVKDHLTSPSAPSPDLRKLLNRHLCWIDSQIQKKDIAIAQTRQEIELVSDTSKRRFALRQRMSRLSSDRKPIFDESHALKTALILTDSYDYTFANGNDPAALATVQLFDQVVRLKEEVPLLLKELKQYASYFAKQCDALHSRLQDFHEGQSRRAKEYCLSGADSHAKKAFMTQLRNRFAECALLRDNAINFLRQSKDISVSFISDYCPEFDSESENELESDDDESVFGDSDGI